MESPTLVELLKRYPKTSDLNNYIKENDVNSALIGDLDFIQPRTRDSSKDVLRTLSVEKGQPKKPMNEEKKKEVFSVLDYMRLDNYHEHVSLVGFGVIAFGVNLYYLHKNTRDKDGNSLTTSYITREYRSGRTTLREIGSYRVDSCFLIRVFDDLIRDHNIKDVLEEMDVNPTLLFNKVIKRDYLLKAFLSYRFLTTTNIKNLLHYAISDSQEKFKEIMDMLLSDERDCYDVYYLMTERMLDPLMNFSFDLTRKVMIAISTYYHLDPNEINERFGDKPRFRETMSKLFREEV